jgi:acetolactate synthase-1/3 small subunit
VSATPESRSHILQLAHVFRARVVDVAPGSIIVEITGTEDKIDGLLEVLRPYGVLEMVRTGRVAMSRGAKAMAVTVSGGTLYADEYSQPDDISYSV